MWLFWPCTTRYLCWIAVVRIATTFTHKMHSSFEVNPYLGISNQHKFVSVAVFQHTSHSREIFLWLYFCRCDFYSVHLFHKCASSQPKATSGSICLLKQKQQIHCEKDMKTIRKLKQKGNSKSLSETGLYTFWQHFPLFIAELKRGWHGKKVNPSYGLNPEKSWRLHTSQVAQLAWGIFLVSLAWNR